MKHTFLKIASGIVLSGFLVFSTTTTVSAKSNKKQAESSFKISPEVKFAGTDTDGATLLVVYFEAAAPVKFEVVMTDVNGNEFFNRDFESARFQKTFKLVNLVDGYSGLDLTLSIRMTETGKTHQFKINSTVEQVAGVAISKL